MNDWDKNYNKIMALRHGFNTVEAYFDYLEGKNERKNKV